MARLIDFAMHHQVSLIACVVLLLGGLVSMRTALVAWTDAVKLEHEERSFFQRMLEPIVTRVGPRSEIAERELRLALQRAGLRDETAMRKFAVARLTSIASAFVFGLLYDFTSGATVLQCIGVIVVLLIVGFNLPDIWLSSRVSDRQARIARALPTVIDMMVLCLDVGLSVEAAFERVTQEMRSMEPLMADEASVMVSEVGAGFTFPQALRRMAERIGLEELITLARLINQASQLGASIATSLREYSEASFEKRMLTLEENAGKISSMMVMPVTLCMLPAAMIALVGPAMIMLSKSFMKV